MNPSPHPEMLLAMLHWSEGRQAALRRLGLPEARAKVGRSSLEALRMAASPAIQKTLNNQATRPQRFVMQSDLKS